MDTLIVENETAPRSAFAWSGVLAGAAISTALSLALLALGAGLGFSVMGPWSANSALPTTTKAAAVAGVYLTVTAVFCSAVGGFIAARLRNLWPGVHHHEAFFRDTVHGVAAWAVSILATAAFLGGTTALVAGGAVQGRISPFEPMVDRLFLGGGDAASRTMAERTFAHLRSERTLTDEQRQSLAALVAARNGITRPEAEQRLTAVESEARAAADTARHVAMQLSFWFCAAMFAGALAAGLAGWEGGAVRDGRMVYGSD